MQCKDFESVLASEGFGLLPAEAREHLDACARCKEFLADIDSIVAVARTLPAEVAPPDRLWISLRAQLEAEGLIKEQVGTTEHASWWENLVVWFRPRSLATAGAALILAVTVAFLTHTRNRNVAEQAAPPTVAGNPQLAGSENTSAPEETHLTGSGKSSAPGPPPSRVKELKPSPSENASTTLSETELDVSNMQLAGGNGNAKVDASLRQNLRTLNEFIAECEQHLRKHPKDELAREYLNMAYQQKADLLAAMMESGRSEH